MPNTHKAPEPGLERGRNWPAALMLLATGASVAPWALGASGALEATGIASAGPFIPLALLLCLPAALQTWHQRRRQQELMLLEALNRVANPHLGLAHSLSRMCQITQEFFGASSCTLELPPACSSAARTDASRTAHRLSADQQISAAVPWQGKHVRLCLRRQRPWSRHEGRLLRQIAHRAFAMLERLDQLERLGEQTAQRERQRLALDLHDSALQPYIGLKLALEALHLRMEPDHPLQPALRNIVNMAQQVIEDLRSLNRAIEAPQNPQQALCLELQQQADALHQLHGVHIAVHAQTQEPLSQRLRHEVVQMVREGLSNIRKHTPARRGEVHLHCDGRWLGLRIANEGIPAARFTPHSISQRAAALGGQAKVYTQPNGQTAVHVHIPL